MSVCVLQGIELPRRTYRAYPTGRIDLTRRSKLTATIIDLARRAMKRDMLVVWQIVNEPETGTIQILCDGTSASHPDQVTFLVKEL